MKVFSFTFCMVMENPLMLKPFGTFEFCNTFSSALLYLDTILKFITIICLYHNHHHHHHHPPQGDCLVAGFWTKCNGPLGGSHGPKPGIWYIWYKSKFDIFDIFEIQFISRYLCVCRTCVSKDKNIWWNYGKIPI